MDISGTVGGFVGFSLLSGEKWLTKHFIAISVLGVEIVYFALRF